jgi:hypothetical protein
MNKFLNIVLSLAVIGLFFSCSKIENDIFEGQFLQVPAASQNFSYDRINDGVGVPSTFFVSYAGAPTSSPVDFSFAIDPASTAIENLHYTLDGTSASIPAGEFSGDLPITILDDNINPGEVLSLIVSFTGSSVEFLPSASETTYNISVLCESDLATTYSFTTADPWMGAPTSGTGELTGGDGEYQFSDFSFGTWAEVYQIDPPSGNLTFTENCGIVGINGQDNYGDTWSLSDVIASGGPEFTFRYENTYGEFATVTLVKDDGSDWPNFVN